MLVPSTPTSTSGAFWKGSELGTEPQAQPAAPSTTSEVVKSKSASRMPLPPASGLPPPLQHPGLEESRGEEHPEARQVGPGWEATWTHCPPWLCSPGAMVGDQAD